MNKFLKIFNPIPLILITVGFPTANSSQTVGINMIYEVKGKVSVEKKQWKKPQPASVELTLSSDDKLEVAANSSVKVYCSNTTIMRVKQCSGCRRRKQVMGI